MNLKTKKNIIATALGHEIAVSLINVDEEQTFPKRFLEFFSKKVNPNSFSDREIISKEEIHDSINWNSMERNKVIRILSRDISFINNFNLYEYNFSIMEWYPLFLKHPYLIDEINIDFNNLNTSEAILLLECNQDLVDKIDIFNYEFKKRDILHIIKKFKRSEKIMNKLNLNSLDHYNTAKLICETGELYLKNLDLKKLKATDWINILEKKPELINYCDVNIFIKNDCYLLTKFVILYPMYEDLIYENVDKISGLGWEYLLIKDIERYRDICKWNKLSENSWNNIIRYHPELKVEKQKRFLF